MAKTKLRKTIYIGLGGTGMKSILKTKKMFIDNYHGQVPPMIGFLGLDTDGDAYNNVERTARYGDIKLDASEQCSLIVKNPMPFYESNKRDLKWMKVANANMIINLDKGAGQVRTNGRLAFIHNLDTIKNAIDRVFTRISNDAIIDNPDYELLDSERVEIHVIFSVGGGTGCGTFLDMGYLLQYMFNTSGPRRVTISGYGVLPDVFVTMKRGGNAMQNVRPNAFGAIQDLDFLMHLTPSSEKVQMPWMGDEWPTNTKPYDAFYFVDNTNACNVIYDHVDKLADMLSLVLVSNVGEIGNNAGSVADNTEKHIITGDLDVGNKRAWASCVGASQITFRNDALSDIYGIQAQISLLQRLLNRCQNGSKMADAWIDTVHIRENEGSKNDEVLNALATLADYTKTFELEKIENCRSEAEARINEQLSKAERKIKEAQLVLENEKPIALQEEVKRILNSGNCSICGALEFLNSLERIINSFIGEEELMGEKNTLEVNISEDLSNKWKNAVTELERLATKLLHRTAKTEATEDVIAKTKKMIEAKVDLARHIAAIQFFKNLLTAIDKEKEQVQKIKEAAEALYDEYCTNMDNKRQEIKRKNSVEVDLAEEYWDKIVVADEQLVISACLGNMPGGQLYNVTNKEQLAVGLDAYVKTLAGYTEWSEKSIDDMINGLSEEEFETVVQRAVDKATPFMKINGKGKRVKKGKRNEISQAINDFYYVCLPDKEKSRFTQNNWFKNRTSAILDIDFISSGLNDRIIIYRMRGVVPAFAIAGVDDFGRGICYGEDEVSFHFDAELEKRMKREHYDLNVDESMDDAMLLWVYGLIFGLIKYDDKTKTYWFKDKNNGKPQLKFMRDTEKHYRSEAFEVFNDSIGEVKEDFVQYINEQLDKMGKDKQREMFEDITKNDAENYIPKYSQYPLSSGRVDKAHKEDQELLDNEIRVVTREGFSDVTL